MYNGKYSFFLGDKMKAYIYQRISTVGQKQGGGLDRQHELTHSYATSNGLDIQLDSFQDIASGYHGKQMNGRLGVFLDAIKSGKVETPAALVVESLDRLGREHTMDALPRLMDIVNSGIEIHEVSTGVVYNRVDTHKLHIAIAVMERAHNESKVKALRATQAHKRAFEQAADTGKIISKQVPAWLTVTNGKVELIPERAALVQRIFDLYNAGAGGTAIANIFRSEDIPYMVDSINRHKHPPIWNEVRIMNIIKSTATYGTFTSKSNNQIIYDYFPAVIDINTYNRAQAIRKQRTTKRTKTITLRNIFTGMLVCGSCGFPYHPNISTTTVNGIKTPIDYLRCSGKATFGNCKAKSYKLKDTETVLLNWFRSIRLEQLSVDHSNELLQKKAEITQLNEQANNLLELLTTGNKRVIEKFEAIEKQLAQAERDLVTLNESNIKPSINRIEASKAIDQNNTELRRLVNIELQRVIEKIVIYTDHPQNVLFSIHFKNKNFSTKYITGKRSQVKSAKPESELPIGWHTLASNIE